MFEYITDASQLDTVLSKNRSSYSAIVGYFCSYFPVELLYGFNICPVKIMGYAQTYIQKRDLINYMCAYLTDIINSFEENYYSWANHLIIPATCDSLYGAKDYFEKNIGGTSTKMFRLPLKFTPEAYKTYKSAVEEVLDWLSESYSFDNELIKKSIKINNQMNSNIVNLLGGKGVPFEGVIYLKLMIAKSVLPYPVFMSLLEDITEDMLEKNYSKERNTVMLLGPISDNLDLIDYINTDHNVNTKFMSSSLGLYRSSISVDGDIKDNVIRYYFSKAGTVTSYNYFTKIKSELDHEIKEHSIKGIIYLNYKFCEPHMFFSRQIKCHLENTDVKFLYLEQEHSKGIDALMQNKIDAFKENI